MNLKDVKQSRPRKHTYGSHRRTFKKSHQQSRVVVPGTRGKGKLIKFQLGGASSRKLLYYMVATVTNCAHQKLLR